MNEKPLNKKERKVLEAIRKRVIDQQNGLVDGNIILSSYTRINETMLEVVRGFIDEDGKINMEDFQEILKRVKSMSSSMATKSILGSNLEKILGGEVNDNLYDLLDSNEEFEDGYQVQLKTKKFDLLLGITVMPIFAVGVNWDVRWNEGTCCISHSFTSRLFINLGVINLEVEFKWNRSYKALIRRYLKINNELGLMNQDDELG